MRSLYNSPIPNRYAGGFLLQQLAWLDGGHLLSSRGRREYSESSDDIVAYSQHLINDQPNYGAGGFLPRQLVWLNGDHVLLVGRSRPARDCGGKLLGSTDAVQAVDLATGDNVSGQAEVERTLSFFIL